ANPTALWAHEAKMYYIAKTYYSSNPIVKTTDMFVPPIKGELQPLSVKPRGNNASVSTDPNSMPAAFRFSNKYAEKTHVIIINGGGNAHINLPNYWNDCSLVYTMLKKCI
ncbi:MAG: hypothetical protein J1E29_07850, partial [Duncaniella sp.]|nr:hypothetical protein [Duncaniella sp.]